MKLDASDLKRHSPANRRGIVPLEEDIEVHATVTGANSLRFKFCYSIDGKKKQMSLGTYPRKSLPEIVRAHSKAKAFVHAGIDPIRHGRCLRDGEKPTTIEEEKVKNPRRITISELGATQNVFGDLEGLHEILNAVFYLGEQLEKWMNSREASNSMAEVQVFRARTLVSLIREAHNIVRAKAVQGRIKIE